MTMPSPCRAAASSAVVLLQRWTTRRPGATSLSHRSCGKSVDRDSVFGPAFDEIHREFSTGGKGRSDWLGRDPVTRIATRTEADSVEEPLLQLADVAAGMHCSVIRDAAGGARLNRQQQELWSTWAAARSRGRHFVSASQAVHAIVAPART
jgi:hypothetical protein